MAVFLFRGESRPMPVNLMKGSLNLTNPTIPDRATAMSGAGMSRRHLFTTAATGVALAPGAQARDAGQLPVRQQADPRAPVSFELTVNKQRRYLAVDARTSLLDALREHLGLTGAKKGCDHG